MRGKHHPGHHFSHGPFVCWVRHGGATRAEWEGGGWRAAAARTPPLPVEQCRLGLAEVPIAVRRDTYTHWLLKNKDYINIQRPIVVKCDYESTCLRGKGMTGPASLFNGLLPVYWFLLLFKSSNCTFSRNAAACALSLVSLCVSQGEARGGDPPGWV